MGGAEEFPKDILQDLGGSPDNADLERTGWRKPWRPIGRNGRGAENVVLMLAASIIGVWFMIKAVDGMRGGKSTGSKVGDVVLSTCQSLSDDSICYSRPCPPDRGEIMTSNGLLSTSTLHFSNRSHFSLTHLVSIQESDGRSPITTKGDLHFRHEKDQFASTLRVDLTFFFSHLELSCSQSVEATDSSLTIKTPSSLPFSRAKHGQSHIHILATVWVPPGIKLDTLEVATEALSINFHPGLNSTIARSTHISTGSGSIRTTAEETLPYESTADANVINEPAVDQSSQYSTLVPRETIIDSKSGSISGSYPLYDLLSITTNSGSIHVNIHPKPASPSNPLPALLRLAASSGSIRAYTPFLTTSVANRTYNTEIHSQSGSVEATLIHGVYTSLRTNSGHMRVSLYPYGPNTTRSDLITDSKSSGTEISLHSSLSHPGSPLRRLYASHRAVSGSIRLVYPAQWEGRIEGETMSGSVCIDWEGVRIVRDEKWGGGRRVEGVKGEGEGTLGFRGMSGSVELRGGG